MHTNCSISLVVPAYQEEKRIGLTIQKLSEYLSVNHPGAELIVVCDGCTDGSAAVARATFAAPNCTLKVLELPENQGKGAAVKAGMLEAAGDYLLFTDADLSFPPEILEEFLSKLVEGADVVIAQRKKETTYPTFGRRLLGSTSRFLVGHFILPGIKDSQAGYKAFSRKAAKDLFNALQIKRFLFDLEILVMAVHKNYKIELVYTDWLDRPGSTVRIVVDTLRSLRDLAHICWRAWSGQYD